MKFKLKVESFLFGTIYVIEGEIPVKERVKLESIDGLVKMVEWGVSPELYEEMLELADIYLECKRENIYACLSGEGLFALECGKNYILHVP